MTVKLAPVPRQQYVNSSGVPYSGAKLFYYAAGTTTKQNTYTTSVGDVANTNPIILDSSGRTPYGVHLTAGVGYKAVLAPANDTDPPASPIFTEDNIYGINDEAVGSQWVASGVMPTYVSATQFTVPGDKTSTFLVDRRVKCAVTAGTVYGYISASTYTTLTTVTVVLDSGSLDSGLNAVEVGILTDLLSAIPSTVTKNTAPQTLTNKSLSDSTTYIIDNVDGTKKFQIQASGITTGTTRTMTVPDKDFTPATVAANTFTGAQTMSGASVIDATASVAAHPTTAAVWLLGNYVTLTGGATVFTDVADAPQAGAEVELYCNAAHTFTNNANFIVDGGANFVAQAGDRVLLRAQSTSVFTVHPRRSSAAITASGLTQATSRLLGRTTASTGAIEEISVGTGLSLSAGSLTNTSLSSMILLSTVTASNSATVDIETTFNSTYDAYLLVVSGMTVTVDGQEIRLRMKLGGAYNTDATGYHWSFSEVSSEDTADTFQSVNSTGADYIRIATEVGNNAAESANFQIKIYNPSSTAFNKIISWEGVMLSQKSSTIRLWNVNGVGVQKDVTTALTGIRIYGGSGNILAGKFRLYGIANS